MAPQHTTRVEDPITPRHGNLTVSRLRVQPTCDEFGVLTKE
jgi:hypothetical protein